MLYAPSSPGNAKEPSREYYEAAGAVCKYRPLGTLYEKYYFWKEDKADYRFDGEPHWSRADSKKTQLAKAQALVRLHSPFRPAHLTRATDRRSSCAQNPAVKAPHGRWANVADCLPKSQRQPLAPASAGHGSPAVAAPLPSFAAIPTPSPPTASNEQDLKTRRDLAILRGFLHLPDAVAVLESIQTAGLDDDEDPFTLHRVRQRHELLCRSFRIVNRLVGGMGGSGIARMSELASLCV